MKRSLPGTGARIDWPGAACGAALAAGAIAVYGRTLTVPLLFDDRHSIAENGTIRHLWPIGLALHPPSQAGVGGRPVLNLSYALNYAFGGTSVFGYHLVNLLVHVLAAWVLFGIARRTLTRWSALSPTRLSGRGAEQRVGDNALHLAFAISAIWCLHPLQTEAVTYLSERAESLMGLFYLLTLYCFIRYADADGETEARRLVSVSTGWAALSVLACLCGVASKEVMVSAPVVVLLYDRTFVSGSFFAAGRRHRWLYAGLAACWLPLGWFAHGLGQRGVGFGQGLTAWSYGLIESRVVVKYLLLVFWPSPLIFDYGRLPIPRLAEVWPYLVVLVVLVGATGWGLFRRPVEPVGLRLRPMGYGGRSLGFAEGPCFAGAWFFLILAPTSSLVPIAGQSMAESRMYLPLAGVVAAGVLGVYSLAGRGSWLLFAMIAAGLGLISVRRNQSYASEAAIWSDTVAKLPANPRAHNNLGNAWSVLPGRSNDAIAELTEAIRLKPDYAEAHYSLGVAWAKQPGRLGNAIGQYEEALRLDPGYAEAHFGLGSAWAKLPGRWSDAIAEYEAALRLEPDYAEAHDNLGIALAHLPGRSGRAIAEFEQAVRLEPANAQAHNNLGIALAGVPGRLREAIGEFNAAVRLKPNDAATRQNLAAALQIAGTEGVNPPPTVAP